MRITVRHCISHFNLSFKTHFKNHFLTKLEINFPGTGLAQLATSPGGAATSPGTNVAVFLLKFNTCSNCNVLDEFEHRILIFNSLKTGCNQGHVLSKADATLEEEEGGKEEVLIES